MLSETIFTTEEVAGYLKVSEQVVLQEIAAGRLAAFDVAGHVRIGSGALSDYLKTRQSASGSKPLVQPGNHSVGLRSVPDFTHTWPAKKGEPRTTEKYTNALEGIAQYQDKEYHVRVGYTFRESAGKKRRRSLVLVNRYPSVEFVAADEKVTGGKMAAILRDRNAKQLPVGATPPPEYAKFPIAPYSQVVKGPGASTGLAVVCDSKDIDTMVGHALIRYRFGEDRK